MKINNAKIVEVVFERVENVRKGESAGYHHNWSCSLSVFKTVLSQDHSNTGLCDTVLKLGPCLSSSP